MLNALSTEFLTVWPEIFLADALRYLIPAGLMTAALALFAERLANRRIQTRRATRNDRLREIRYSISTAIIFSLTGFLIHLGDETGVLQVQAQFVPSLGCALVQTVLIVVAHDAYFYWMHRAMHHPRVFRLVHRVHHLSRTPTPWAAYAFAPLEAVVEALFLPLYLLVFETSGLVIAIFLFLMMLRNVLGHAGVELFPARWLNWPLLRSITTTTHHDLHHSEFNYNFGLYFCWWDRWMGTEHPGYRTRFETVTTTKDKGAKCSTDFLQPTEPARRSGGSRTLIVAFVAVLSGELMLGSNLAAASEKVEGLWVTPGVGAIVRVSHPTPAELSARVLWVMDDKDEHAIGEAVFRNMHRRGDVWQGGEIYNPDNGKTYRGSVRFDGDYLSVKGCIGPFCQSQQWLRYSTLLARLPRIEDLGSGSTTSSICEKDRPPT